MNRLIDIHAIEARRTQIGDEIQRLQQELKELDLALRVLHRFETKIPAEAGHDSSAKLGPARPEGIPSNIDMAEALIGAANDAGRPGLTAAELVDGIRTRWWPGLQASQVMPIFYQYAKRGRLLKGDDGIFRLPLVNEASSVAAEEASETEDGGNSSSGIFS